MYLHVGSILCKKVCIWIYHQDNFIRIYFTKQGSIETAVLWHAPYTYFLLSQQCSEYCIEYSYKLVFKDPLTVISIAITIAWKITVCLRKQGFEILIFWTFDPCNAKREIAIDFYFANDHFVQSIDHKINQNVLMVIC